VCIYTFNPVKAHLHKTCAAINKTRIQLLVFLWQILTNASQNRVVSGGASTRWDPTIVLVRLERSSTTILGKWISHGRKFSVFKYIRYLVDLENFESEGKYWSSIFFSVFFFKLKINTQSRKCLSNDNRSSRSWKSVVDASILCFYKEWQLRKGKTLYRRKCGFVRLYKQYDTS